VKRGWLDGVLARSPAQPLFLWRAERRWTVLAYHAVNDPESFDGHLAWLRRRFHPVSLEQVIAALDGGAGLPRRAVLITFDDGDRSMVTAALPRLTGHGMPAVAFVVSSLLDGQAPPWWRQVEAFRRQGVSSAALSQVAPGDEVAALKRLPDHERRAVLAELAAAAPASPTEPQLTRSDLTLLEAGGVAIGNHSYDHPCLDRCDDAEVERQLAAAHRDLTAALGHETRAFAYPNGNLDPRAEPVLSGLGYRLGFLFDHRSSPWPPPHPLRVSRVRVNSDSPPDRFRILASGLHSALHRVRGRN
jgi:peptidoglycan/xylan/chitin deacetylase (PgdA/CDA1 family)